MSQTYDAFIIESMTMSTVLLEEVLMQELVFISTIRILDFDQEELFFAADTLLKVANQCVILKQAIQDVHLYGPEFKKRSSGMSDQRWRLQNLLL